jgi:hypothetical protein
VTSAPRARAVPAAITGAATTRSEGSWARRARTAAHRRAGRDSVVDQNDGAAGHGGRRPVAAVERLPPRQFAGFPRDRVVQEAGRDAEGGEDRLVAVDDPAGGERTHGEFRVAGHAELADDEDIEGQAEGAGHLGADRDASARQGQDEGSGTPAPLREEGGETPACVDAVAKEAFHAVGG